MASKIPVSYSKFSVQQVCDLFSLTPNLTTDLFGTIAEVEASDFLKTLLAKFVPLGEGANTEKSRSEFIIAPILAEVCERASFPVSLFSGKEFSVEPEQGLTGVCDFIFSASANLYEIVTPVLLLVEAKKENLPDGFGQCAAEMVAARIFNQRAARGINTIYGAVTTGNDWRFLKLEGDVIYIDRQLYYLAQRNKLLGILLHMLQGDLQAQALAA
jgi:hypothetical protein